MWLCCVFTQWNPFPALAKSMFAVNFDRYDNKPESVLNPNTGQAAMRMLSDPLDIYKKLREIKDDKIRREQELEDKRRQEDSDYASWYASKQFEIASAASRGEIATASQYTIATPQEAKEKRYPCQYCSKRFTTESEETTFLHAYGNKYNIK